MLALDFANVAGKIGAHGENKDATTLLPAKKLGRHGRITLATNFASPFPTSIGKNEMKRILGPTCRKPNPGSTKDSQFPGQSVAECFDRVKKTNTTLAWHWTRSVK